MHCMLIEPVSSVFTITGDFQSTPNFVDVTTICISEVFILSCQNL